MGRKIRYVLLLAVVVAVGTILLRSVADERPRLASVSVPAESPEAFLFRNVSVFDGETMRRSQDVLVVGDRVEALAQTGTFSAPGNALEIDGVGRTLLPGLIDSHVHFFAAGEKAHAGFDADDIAHAMLFSGVTSVLVAAGFEETDDLVRSRRDRSTLTPNLWTSGPGITAPGGHPTNLLKSILPWPLSWIATRGVPTAATGEQARQHVRSIAANATPDFVKIIYDDLPPGTPHLDLDVLRAAIDETRMAGARPIVHATTPRDAIEAAEAGAALLAHVPQRGTLTDSQVERLVELGVPFVTTVRMITASRELASIGPTPLEMAVMDRRVLESWQQEPAWNLAGFSEELDENFELVAATVSTNFRMLLNAGAQLFVGTDSGVHGVFPGVGLHSEMQMLEELGMEPIEILRSVTSRPGKFLAPGGTVGQVSPGATADLLLVRGDPTAGIGVLASIEEVFLAGQRLERSGL